MTKRFYLVTYDIEQDRARNRLAKLLKSFGERVQKSVFEVLVDQRQLERLQRAGASLLEENDSIRWYRLCAECVASVEITGKGRVTEIPDVWIV